jgi:hypothetical protein
MSLEKFWKKVEKTDHCWNWIGAPKGRKDLYGQVKRPDGRNQSTHRFLYEQLNNVVLPRFTLVCHHCDNKRCVRPDHLFIGTSKDNSQDCQQKGRRNFQIGNANFRRGEQIAWSKLTPELVIVIRNHYAIFGGTRAIAEVIGISYKVAWKAAVGQTWAHLPFPRTGKYLERELNSY